LKRPAIHAEKMQIAGLAYERRDDAIEVGDVVIAVDDAAAVHQMFIPQVVDKKPFDRAAEMVVANAVRTLVKRDQCSVSLLLRRVVLSRTLGLAIELRFGLGEFEPMLCGARALPKSSSHCVPLRKLPSLRRNDVCRAGTVA
jgi:hypothetical protein